MEHGAAGGSEEWWQTECRQNCRNAGMEGHKRRDGEQHVNWRKDARVGECLRESREG